jgi:DNA-binding transcriptional LysR family regulator
MVSIMSFSCAFVSVIAASLTPCRRWRERLAVERLGLGLVQVPRYHLADDLATGRLVVVLSDYTPEPTPVMALYPGVRQLLPHVRVFLDWLSTLAFAS